MGSDVRSIIRPEGLGLLAFWLWTEGVGYPEKADVRSPECVRRPILVGRPDIGVFAGSN